jgi:molybdenum cofactor cytidylyltransferase/nicotine blue oxidoreductase
LTTAAAILAGGRGSRLGGDAAKPLLDWRGRPLVQWAVDAALASVARPVLVIVGYRGDEVAAALADREVVIVDNPEWEEGIASSLRRALETLTPVSDVSAVCVGLADQPMVGPGAYDMLSMVSGGEIAVANYDGEPGNPVKLTRSIWPEALKLRGDAGARVLMRNRVVDWVDCTDTGSAADIDTLEDLGRLRRQEETR